MSAIESDPGWYERMALRTAARQLAAEEAGFGQESTLTSRLRNEIDNWRRAQWPVPPELRGYSARDCFLWYIRDGWRKIFGEDPPVEVVFDHDFGYHVLRKGRWQLTLIDTEEFPEDTYPSAGPGADEPGASGPGCPVVS